MDIQISLNSKDTIKWVKYGLHLKSSNGRFEITTNKYLDNDRKDYTLYVDGEYIEDGALFKLKKRAVDFQTR